MFLLIGPVVCTICANDTSVVHIAFEKVAVEGSDPFFCVDGVEVVIIDVNALKVEHFA